jgi:hypothetical protein
MPICPDCGIDLDEGTKLCPLCGRNLTGDDNHFISEMKPDTADNEKRTHPWLLELYSFFLLAAFLIVPAVDFAYGGNLSWSRIPMASIFFAWLLVFLLHHFKKRPYLLVLLEILNFLLLLWALDQFTPTSAWFLPLALPIILVIGIIVLLIILWIRSFKLKILPSLAIGTLSVGIFLLCLELILNLYHNKIFISWSIVAFACIIPVSGLFVYLQLKIKKRGSDLKKFFHI